jgi:predicted CoA-binding protein
MQKISCELPDGNPPSKEIQKILAHCRTIAVVGLSPKESRDSNRVARYLIQEGYEVVPVNPGQREILGKTCYRSVADIPFQVDMADLFLNPARVPPVVDQAIDKGIRAIWMQSGVVHNAAAQKAREAGIQVVMNRCIMQEHKKMAMD